MFVTHDLQEAFALGDRIIAYDQGAVLQSGARDEVFRQPSSIRVAQLLDARNVFEGRVAAKHEEFTEIETPWFRARARPEGKLAPNAPAAFSIRPEHVILIRRDRPRAESLDTELDVEIEDEVATGNSHRLYLRVLRDGAATDCVIECDVPAHPYEVMGVASTRQWRIALSLQHATVIPV